MFKALFALVQIWFKAWFSLDTALEDQAAAEQWVNLGNSLSNSLSLGVGLEETDSDHWTTEKLLQMGQSLSHIHPGI